MSDMSVNLSMGGAFYRAAQNQQKVSKAVNSMLYRLETGQKYQYAYQNVSAVTEGSTLKSDIATQESSVDNNGKLQAELDPVMQAQTEIMNILGQMKEVAAQYANDSTGSGAAALSAQYAELASAANELAGGVSFNGATLAAGLSGNVNAGNSVSHAVSTTAINIDGTSINAATIDTAISNLAADSAKLGVLYNNVLESNKSIMNADINAMTLRYSSILTADDNETSSLLVSLNSRMDAINAARQYAAGYAGNSINLTNILV